MILFGFKFWSPDGMKSIFWKEFILSIPKLISSECVATSFVSEIDKLQQSFVSDNR